MTGSINTISSEPSAKSAIAKRERQKHVLDIPTPPMHSGDGIGGCCVDRCAPSTSQVSQTQAKQGWVPYFRKVRQKCPDDVPGACNSFETLLPCEDPARRRDVTANCISEKSSGRGLSATLPNSERWHSGSTSRPNQITSLLYHGWSYPCITDGLDSRRRLHE